MYLKLFTPFAITIIRASTTEPVRAATTKLRVRFTFSLVYSVNFIGFGSTCSSPFSSVFYSPPLCRLPFETYASVTVTIIGSLTAVVTIRTAIRVLVIRVARGNLAIDFWNCSSTPVYIIIIILIIYELCTQLQHLF